MKTKTFKYHEDAISYAHSCQMGNKDAALIVKTNYFVVCPLDEVDNYQGNEDHVERFKAASSS